MKPTGHPWGDFLFYRARALRWLRDEMKNDPGKICQTMAMDPGQVRLILMTVDENPTDYDLPGERCSGMAPTIGGGSFVRCGDVAGHAGAHRHRQPGEWESPTSGQDPET